MPIKWPVLVLFLFMSATAFCLFYSRIENFFVFFPDRSHDSGPERIGLKYQDFFFEAPDGNRLHGWFFPLPGDSPVILFCDGNAGNISHRLENVRPLVDRGLRVFIFDYRGYGKSTGRPSEKGIYKDGLAACDWLVRGVGIPSGGITAFGRSLGAAVALEVALRREVKSLVLEGAFTSTRDMAKTMFLFNVLSPLLPAHYDNLSKIPLLRVPKLIIHGRRMRSFPFLWEKTSSQPPKTPNSSEHSTGPGITIPTSLGGANISMHWRPLYAPGVSRGPAVQTGREQGFLRIESISTKALHSERHVVMV